MINHGRSANTTSPGWRPLTALAALVVAAHALLLQASPAQLGAGLDPDDAGGKILITRSINAAPAPPAQTTAAPAAVKKAVKTAQNTLKNPSSQPLDQQIQGQAAPEIIAPTEPQPASPPIAEVPVETAAAATPTQTATTLPVGPKTTLVTAISLPGSVRLQYKVIGLSKNLNYQATAELDWKTNGDTYVAMMKVSAFLVGSRSMTSVGNITSSGLAPTRYADKFRSELAAHFEADKGKITFSANTPDAPWIEGVQDRASVFFQLSGMLAAKPLDFPPGTSVTFLTIGPREADTWTFIIESEENLDLMGAPMAALKLTRKPRKEFDQKVEIWFAPSLGYLPVRSRITQQNGDFIDQQLTDVSKSL
ncbi:MAG: DUF3108 domain-containing protein [Polaromonas sp.]|nr:DUF3108 domain-containing protein [Polaromonas sp.]